MYYDKVRISLYWKMSMTLEINGKLLAFLTAALFLWLMGILFTPLMAAANISWMQQMADIGYFFYDPLCHQIPDRSFGINGFSLAVCVRCFSVYLAGFFLFLSMFRTRVVRLWSLPVYLLLVLPALADFILEKIFIYQNLTFIRFITGFLMGIALFHLLLVSFTTPNIYRIDVDKTDSLKDPLR